MFRSPISGCIWFSGSASDCLNLSFFLLPCQLYPWPHQVLRASCLGEFSLWLLLIQKTDFLDCEEHVCVLAFPCGSVRLEFLCFSSEGQREVEREELKKAELLSIQEEMWCFAPSWPAVYSGCLAPALADMGMNEHPIGIERLVFLRHKCSTSAI